MYKKKSRFVLGGILILALLVAVNNYLILTNPPNKRPQLLAHRGLAQTFDIAKVKWNTNTAAMIYAPEHFYIENTIPSMKAAFEYGADIVEFDIRVTKDKQLVVFHDDRVDSRTEKQGKVSDYSLAELKKMDVGYGYTHDAGKTFPLRNLGIGLLPAFDEVIQEFPGKEFLVHLRDPGKEIGELFLKKLNAMSAPEIEQLSIYGNDTAIEMIKLRYPKIKALSLKIIKRAVLEYELIGWTGYIPNSIRNIEIHLPLEYARFLWGWPVKLITRMNAVNTRFVIVKRKGPWSGGFDSIDEIKEIPADYYGCIWTDRIDRIADFYKR